MGILKCLPGLGHLGFRKELLQKGMLPQVLRAEEELFPDRKGLGGDRV